MQILGRDIIISLAIIIAIILTNTKKRNEKVVSLYNIGIILFTTTIVIIYSLTGISPISGFHTEIRINEISVIPLSTIIGMVQGGLTFHTIINILGNIMMFMPIGFLTPLLWNNLKSLKNTLVLGFSISLLIEITQLFLSRASDIDDLILNTSGVVLGYLVFMAFNKLFPKFKEKMLLQSKTMENKYMLAIGIFIPYIVIIVGGIYDRISY